MPQIALIGVGPWGSNYIEPLVRSEALCALVDSDPVALNSAVVPDGIGRYLTLDDLLAEKPSLDGVIVASAAATHFDIAVRALYQGLGVLVEKPIAQTLPQAAELYRLAASKAVTLMSGHLLMHHEGFHYLWRETKTGRLGEPRYIRSTRVGIGRIRREEDVLWSFAVHDLSLVLTLMGQMPESLFARKYWLRGAPQADLAIVDLTFQAGARAAIHVSWLGPEREHRLLTYARRGAARFDDGEEGRRSVVMHAMHPGEVRHANATGQAERTAAPPQNARPLDRQVDLFCRYVATGTMPLQDRAIALGVMSLLEAADLSSANESEVRVRPAVDIDSTLFEPSCNWPDPAAGLLRTNAPDFMGPL